MSLVYDTNTVSHFGGGGVVVDGGRDGVSVSEQAISYVHAQTRGMSIVHTHTHSLSLFFWDCSLYPSFICHRKRLCIVLS